MLSREMAIIIENADKNGQLHYDAADIMDRLANSRPISDGIVANLTEIVCGVRHWIGQRVQLRPERAAFWASANLTPDEVGTITLIRWPNSENLGQLVIQADFHERNYHLRPDEIVALA